MTVYRLSTVIIYSTAYRLPIWIAYKISYKHALYFGIPGVSPGTDNFRKRNCRFLLQLYQQPLYAMAVDPYPALWCIIQGDSMVFDIIVPGDTRISQLEKLIWEKCKNTLRKFDAAELVLWKVSSECTADSSQLTC